MSARGLAPIRSSGPRGPLPAYAFPENAALALSSAERYSRWRKRPTGSFLSFDKFTQSAIRAVIDRVLAAAHGPVWLEPADIATVLRAAGIDFATIEVASAKEAPAVADRMGYPLVLKVKAPEVFHESDIGGVILGLTSPGGVRTAIETLGTRMRGLGIRLENVVLQREVKGGIEALVGVTTDPTFGPLVVCGLGGILVELLKDVSFRLSPVSECDAEEMIDRLRAARLLDGYRGAPPGDRQALVQVVQKVSALVELVPELRELDLNPVKVLEPGSGALVVHARMRVG
jgi:acyl-CoA synthetase (NDP forming)